MWLSTNISANKLSKKLDHKMISYFKIIGKKSILLELQLPQNMKIYNIFYPDLLRKASIDPLIS